MTSSVGLDDVSAEKTRPDILAPAACGIANDYNVDLDDGYNTGPFVMAETPTATDIPAPEAAHPVADKGSARYHQLQKQNPPGVAKV